MESINDIKLKLGKHRNRLFSEYPIESMAIFGSYTREEQQEKSDLDILVEFNGKIGVRFIDLADELENLIGLKVDLVSRKGVKEKYLESITSELVYV